MTKGKVRVPTKHVPEETITRGTKNVLEDLGIEEPSTTTKLPGDAFAYMATVEDPTGHEEDNRTESDD